MRSTRGDDAYRGRHLVACDEHRRGHGQVVLATLDSKDQTYQGCTGVASELETDSVTDFRARMHDRPPNVASEPGRPSAGVAGQLNALGVTGFFADAVGSQLTRANLGWQPLFGLLSVAYYALHYMFASQTAHVGALYSAFLAMMLSSGVRPPQSSLQPAPFPVCSRKRCISAD